MSRCSRDLHSRSRPWSPLLNRLPPVCQRRIQGVSIPRSGALQSFGDFPNGGCFRPCLCRPIRNCPGGDLSWKEKTYIGGIPCNIVIEISCLYR